MLSLSAITGAPLRTAQLVVVMHDMDVQQRRLRRLRELWATRFNGVTADLARAIDKDANQTRFILYPDKAGGRRIGERLARQIEERLGLAPGYLDRESGMEGFIDRVNQLPPALRQHLLEHLELLEAAARELPFAFSAPVDPARMADFNAYLEQLSRRLAGVEEPS